MKVFVDRRPILIIVAEKSFFPILYSIIFGIFYYILTTGRFHDLGLDGRRTLAIFLLCIILWVGQLMPLAITGLLAIVLLPIFGVMKASESYSLFGNQAVFFLIGAFILGAVIQSSGLAARIALVILNRFGNTPNSLLVSVYFLTFFMSWWMPEHVVAAMAFPILLELIRSLNLSPKDTFAKALLLSLCYGCVTGGVATFLGGARVPLAVGILHETTGSDITFLAWLKFAAPTAIILAMAGFTILKIFFKFENVELVKGTEAIQKMIRQRGLMTLREKMVALVTVSTIVAWIVAGHSIGLANIAIISVVSLFGLRLIRWKEAQENVNWGVILMYGGAMVLGEALDRSGASDYIATNMLFKESMSLFAVIATLTILTLLLTAIMNNSAAVAALLPIALGIGKSLNIDPRLITLTIAFNAGIDFALPIGTPATAIVYSSGYLRVRDMLFPGIIMLIISCLIFILLVKYFLPLTGFLE